MAQIAPKESGKNLLLGTKNPARPVRFLGIILVATAVLLCQYSYAATQVSQFGITWTFDRDYTVGQFANGDYWVVGPVNITNITPGWDGEKHGSMVNPMPIPRGQQAYDSRMPGYNPSLLIEAPVTLNANSSLISAISWIVGEPGCPSLVNGTPRPTLRAAAVLTVLGGVPPSNAFRPPYCGSNKPIYLTSNLRKDLLPNLAFVSGTPNIQSVANQFERVWLDHFAHHGDGTQYTSPSENMPNNGRDYTKLVGKAALLLMLDEAELISQQGSNKDTLLIRFVQLGIDLYEVVENGGYWWAGGSLNSGRKWPIIFAGIMLDHSGMAEIGTVSPDMPYEGFQEDFQTFYVGDRDIFPQPYGLRYYSWPYYSSGTVNVVNGSNTVEGVGTSWLSIDPAYAQYFGVEGDDQAYKVDGKAYKIASVIDETHLELETNYTGQTSTGSSYKMAKFVYYGHGVGGTSPRTDFIEYTEEHRGLPEWGQEPATLPFLNGLDWGATYRGSNGLTYPSIILAAHIMGQKQAWNHNALFDYTDRWVEVQNVYGGDFQRDMWLAYRASYGDVWTADSNNQTPVLDSIGNKSVSENSPLTFDVEATDGDGDTITYSATGLPSGATFSGQSFSWTPNNSQAGSYESSFTASDGQLQDSETITITVNAVDTSPPTVTNCSPAADAIQVPLNNLIIFHIVDAGKGVDASSVTIKVDNNIMYTGNTADYSSEYGRCRRVGTKADYTFIYQSNEMFDFDQPVTVTVNAIDLAGNTMNEHSYSFKTKMRSFGENKKVDSGLGSPSTGGPATVRDSSGNIWAAWHAGPIGSRDIYISRLAAGADNFGSSVQLTNNASDQCNAALALDGDDRLYVVWQDNKRGNWDIYEKTSAVEGNWSPERLVTDSTDNQVNPAIVVDGFSSANVYIAWQDDRASNQDIYIATASNDFVTKTLFRITSDGSDQVEPAITVDTDNVVYVVWTDGRNGAKDIYGADSYNGPWRNVTIVSKTNNQSSPAIAAEDNGFVLHFLWVDDTPGNKDIYYATSNGLPNSPLSGNSIIDDDCGADQLEPAIAVTGSIGDNLKVFTCWQDQRNAGADLYFAEITSGCRTNVLVSDESTNSDQTEPAMGIDEYGYPYLIWADSRSTNTDICYAGSTFIEPDALASKDVSASLGATVGISPAAISSVDDVSIFVPSGACPYDVKITISKIKNPQAFAMQRLGCYDFGPSGIKFHQPVTVTIPYSLSSSNCLTSAYRYEPFTGTVSQNGITGVETIIISPTLHAIRFKTTHFTQFLIGGSKSSGSKTTLMSR